MADEAKDDDKVAAAGTGPMPADTRWKIFWIVGMISLVLDQVTKIYSRHVLPVRPEGCDIPADIIARKCYGVTVPFIDGFWEWRLSMNTGSAFSLFGSKPEIARIFLSVVGILAVGGMVWMLKKSRADQRVLHWALALVAGGAVGNLIDRILFGGVTDMILWRYQKHEWPVFNIADVALVAGVGLMFIDIHKESKREKAIKAEKIRAAGLAKD